MFVKSPFDTYLKIAIEKKVVPIQDTDSLNLGHVSRKMSHNVLVTRASPYNKKGSPTLLALIGDIKPIFDNGRGTMFEFDKNFRIKNIV